MRNVIQNVPKKNSKPFRESLKAIFRYTDIEIARIAKNELIDKYSHNKRYEKACKILDEGFEDAFQYTIVGQGHSRLKSTNLLDRKSTRLNSSHVANSYAVFCLKNDIKEHGI